LHFLAKSIVDDTRSSGEPLESPCPRGGSCSPMKPASHQPAPNEPLLRMGKRSNPEWTLSSDSLVSYVPGRARSLRPDAPQLMKLHIKSLRLCVTTSRSIVSSLQALVRSEHRQRSTVPLGSSDTRSSAVRTHRIPATQPLPQFAGSAFRVGSF
jgi:hypothetical protein